MKSVLYFVSCMAFQLDSHAQVCLGSTVTQTISPDVYDLGHYRSMESQNRALVEIYDGGTPCDGRPRVTTVRFQCGEVAYPMFSERIHIPCWARQNALLSVAEPAMCRYEAVVGSAVCHRCTNALHWHTGCASCASSAAFMPRLPCLPLRRVSLLEHVPPRSTCPLTVSAACFPRSSSRCVPFFALWFFDDRLLTGVSSARCHDKRAASL